MLHLLVPEADEIVSFDEEPSQSRITYMYEGCGKNDARSKIFCDEEGPGRDSDRLMSCSEDGKPCAQERSYQNDKDGGDADANAPVEVIVGRTVRHSEDACCLFLRDEVQVCPRYRVKASSNRQEAVRARQRSSSSREREYGT